MIWYKYLALLVAACAGIPALCIFLAEAVHRLDGEPTTRSMAAQLVIIATLGVMLGMVFHGVEW